MAEKENHYRSFLLRLWQAREYTGFTWRASLQHVDTGELQGFASIDKLSAYLMQITDEPQESLVQPPGPKSTYLSPVGWRGQKKGNQDMWVNMTFAKMAEAYEKEGLPVLYSQKNMQVMTNAKGFIAGYALFKYGDHTQGCSLSIWESREDAEAFFSSPEYAAMVSEIAQHLVERPDRQVFDVALDMRKVARGET